MKLSKADLQKEFDRLHSCYQKNLNELNVTKSHHMSVEKSLEQAVELLKANQKEAEKNKQQMTNMSNSLTKAWREVDSLKLKIETYQELIPAIVQRMLKV